MSSITVCIFVGIDRITKWYADKTLSLGDTYPVFPNIFHFTLVHNQGMAFGLFQAIPFYFWIIVYLICIGAFFFYIRTIRTPSFVRIFPCLMILSGALGNGIDRIQYHYVIDFFDFRIWPVFNCADAYISVGVVFLFIQIMRKK